MTLEVRNVTKRFGEFTAVNNLTLRLEKGEMFGLLGANGAGKTTTFRMILGLLDVTDGEVLWNNKKVGNHLADIIGYLPEERGLYPKLTVKEQLVYLAKLRGMKKEASIQSLRYWLDRFNVPEYENKKVEELSKGNQQKIQFIASVLHKPELLILDEPFSGLDPVNVELLKSAVHEVRDSGTSIIFSSHRMDHVEELCENLAIMSQGTPIVQGKLKEIKRSFGQKALRIYSDDDLTYLTEHPLVLDSKRVGEGLEYKIAREEDSQDLLKIAAERSFIRKFELDEPSLQDIFIAKVGGKDE
ncbi:ABC transporter ATP-binding protein [Mangrovibacillus cuniculi]|uniref:ABC transporter ATP-binding protein n=1 Tax=Mangrovibacillus cuniculi TaxID=2593652 RepID=A0A7S8HEL3_9BACI|nr:ABC transporter ATP-binding protein [Mangrovibacillus cuniculi]QPC45979.1 ABC transporter ATP-binding protein [Mangrovibacillus cuniculi]